MSYLIIVMIFNVTPNGKVQCAVLMIKVGISHCQTVNSAAIDSPRPVITASADGKWMVAVIRIG